MTQEMTPDNDAFELVTRLTQVAISLSAEKDPHRLLETILLEAQSISRADGGTLYFLNQYDQLEYEIVRTDSLGIFFGGKQNKKPPFKPISLYDEDGVPKMSRQVVNAVISRQAINIEDVYHVDGFDFDGTKRFDEEFGYATKSVLTIPMVNHKHEAIGCLQLVNAKSVVTGETIAFSQDVQQLVEALASMAAVILDNTQLIQAQRALMESFIKIIAQSIDAKSPYTGNHCERVPLLTEMLAEAACNATEGRFKSFNLSEEEKYELHIAGWLHDCGKIVTPVHVMDKSTKLETIHDRIESVRLRIEVMLRDARIRYLEGLSAKRANEKMLTQRYEQETAQLKSDLKFLEKCNIGGEFMEDASIERLEALATATLEVKGETIALLSDNELYNLSVRKGTITKEEREIMNDHMVHTVNMLEAMPWPKHLSRVPEYACGHHEKMDGTGYPRGLLAGTMSIPARMMAIADVFEALTAADRPYKPAKRLSEAMAIIAKLKQCNHLDPELVNFFIESGVYRTYAEMYLEPHLIDEVDEQAIIDLQPDTMHTREHVPTDKE